MIILLRGWDGCGKTSLAERIHSTLPNSELFTVSCSSLSPDSNYIHYTACADDVRGYLTDRPASYAIVDDCGVRCSNLEPFIAVGSCLNHRVFQDIPSSVFEVIYLSKASSPNSRQTGKKLLEDHLCRSSHKNCDADVSFDSLWEYASLPIFNYGYCS